jgi:hypothetical protein
MTADAIISALTERRSKLDHYRFIFRIADARAFP